MSNYWRITSRVTTMCNVWLALDASSACAFAYSARKVVTHYGTAILFIDGSAGCVTSYLQYRQLLTRAHRDDMLYSLQVHLRQLQRNWITRVLNFYATMDVKADIRALQKALHANAHD